MFISHICYTGNICEKEEASFHPKACENSPSDGSKGLDCVPTAFSSPNPMTDGEL